ncbi:hypothetical protein SFBM_0014 [Candidatus Arthromitus sp. SFB-mouse-Japan]|uniref:DUF1189 family protein n=1 Tax=unclassified Candidatus Neoarthromitus TaxID=2638829 RepID=UPI00021B7FE2|nr:MULTISPECIES: DUF1189 family protein [unclassified Candidatus Arthromitus]EIA28072.1 Putative transporter [Candidatus Arthromitus sp. SFB-5]EIA28701.1 hypothetical protein SFB6_031G1 [Candidatus Arthromitus sp. SFB-co]EIA31458.1 hypothetical protein SFBSU_000G15 [Candidatus Arthromitus sp. SFB-mouse-SU]AID43959.1 Hypothetical protein SFBmNL_00018 [Candidatus Arthromitus sp. SFB-mouse-NL]EGX28037.1 hypothetical protein SFBNYU_000250 [Candidatus Arthromitus sp. SFB-mouse-NYU]
MKKEDSFLSTLRIAMFDFKKYTVFLGMKPSKVILNRFIFVLLISVFYFMSFHKNIKQVEEFNNNKQEIFEDISYSNGVLNIKNSPVIFKSNVFRENNFLLIGDTRDEFNINDFSDYSYHRDAIVLTKDYVIIKNGLREITLKYSDLVSFGVIPKDIVVNKEMFFSSFDIVVRVLKYVSYIIFPLSRVFDYFLYGFIISLFAFICGYIIRFRASFGSIYKMILFAQTIPYLIISVFDIITELNGIKVMFPLHILELLTLFIFLRSVYLIKKDALMKYLKK